MKDTANSSYTPVQFFSTKDFIDSLKGCRSKFFDLRSEGCIVDPIYISKRKTEWEAQEVYRTLREIQKGYNKDQLRELSIQIKEERSNLLI